MALVNLDMDLLRTLIIVVEKKSFTAAGSVLLRSQSAISLQMQRLERLVGKKVLERGNGKGISLTPYGHLVHQYACQILDLNDAMMKNLTTHQEATVLRLGIPDDYADLVLPSVIQRLTAPGNPIELQIITELSPKLSEMIDNGELDIAIMTQEGSMDGLSLCDETLAWVARDREVVRSGESLKLALFPDGCGVRTNALRALTAGAYKWDIAYCSKSFSMLKTAMISQGALGVLPRRAVPNGLVALGEEDGLPPLDQTRLIMRIDTMIEPSRHALFTKIASGIGNSLPSTINNPPALCA
ncbi:LysR substrate-binding domain-containing protein [Phyllobacterium leguminum]|uniref:DNA-binding transcriptional LysR family regulator n=1 Tax=Phyllobacterium leguminum TaxID=314237 RepID=A0A318SXM6_9HYPH|nr:LysR substrate-binding domain-containing protein [Phyllobacterium leguminum]PYE85126.1 DNA-binding transcriptional LysR family regulator [Phyllobacterium leguminum]